MVDFVRKYWLSIVAAFAGGTVVATGSMMGVDPVTASHTLTSNVEWMGESVGMLHEDPGNQFGNALLYATSGVAATKGAVKDLKEKVEELGSNVRSILEKEGEIKEARDAAHDAKSKVEKISERNAELVDQIKELQDDQSEIKDMVEEVDMKFQDSSQRGTKNVGSEFVSQIKEQKNKKGLDQGRNPVPGDTFSAKMDGVGIKDITNVSASAGAVVFPDEQEELISSPVLRTPQIMDLLTILETGKDAIEYVKQDSETDNAGPQSGGQGNALSQSDFGFTLKSETIETIGHIAKSSVQILNDAPRLRTWVNTRMQQLLELELEDQVLLGDGTGNNLDGLVPNATSYNSGLEYTVTDDPVTDIDKIGTMLLQLERNNFPPTGIVLSPLNWYGIQLTKDADDNYMFVNPQGTASPRLWGFPVVSSNAMREGEALVGNFEMASTFYDRKMTTLEIATENADDFEKLMVTMRAYLRGLLAVERSNALIHNANMETSTPVGS